MNDQDMRDEMIKHAGIAADHMGKSLAREDDLMLKQVVYRIASLFQNSVDIIPPDRITAKALRILSEAIDHASNTLGDDPYFCKVIRQRQNSPEGLKKFLADMMRDSQKEKANKDTGSTTKDSVWE